MVIGIGFLYIGKNSTSTTPQAEIIAAAPGSTSSAPVAPVTSVTPPKNTPPKAAPNTSGFHSYANAEYNFTIQYPKEVQVRNSFTTFHQIGNNWRLFAGQANQGKPVVELTIFSIDQGSYSTGKQKYPLFFTATVRVGVSPHIKECYTPDAGYTNQKITNVTINGIQFKRFSTSDAGMMQYTQAESYRTIHNNMCYVLEQIKTGSSYRDEKMAQGISEVTLTDYYNKGADIIKTFKFTK